MPDLLRAAVVDDEPLAREGIRLLLGKDPEVEVVGEAGNASEALALLRETVGHGLPGELGRGLSKDAALSTLRGDPAFESLVREAAQPPVR